MLHPASGEGAIKRSVESHPDPEAQQAIAIDASDGQAFGALSNALNRAERWTEAENAARLAIRLTDGEYAYMHFALGRALFGLERWSEARAAFAQAAEMDAANDSAAYNVALSYARMQYYSDAANWYEETLRRNPKRQDAAQIRQRIGALRQ